MTLRCAINGHRQGVRAQGRAGIGPHLPGAVWGSAVVRDEHGKQARRFYFVPV